MGGGRGGLLGDQKPLLRSVPSKVSGLSRMDPVTKNWKICHLYRVSAGVRISVVQNQCKLRTDFALTVRSTRYRRSPDLLHLKFFVITSANSSERTAV